jgi:hypothetical protein
MESYKRGSHTVWDCKYHLVWVTKYRHQVLGGDVGQRCRELLRETARAHEMVVHAGSIKSRPRAHAVVDPAQPVGVACRAIPEGAQFAQAAERVREPAQALLGAAPVGGATGLRAAAT